MNSRSFALVKYQRSLGLLCMKMRGKAYRIESGSYEEVSVHTLPTPCYTLSGIIPSRAT